MTLFNIGTVVSSFTLIVTLLVFPAPSLAVTTMVFCPSANVIALEKDPSVPTVTLPTLAPFNVMVTDTGLDVASLVFPDTVAADLFVMAPVVGDDTVSVGGTVSTVNDAVTAVAALPSLSDALMVILCFPSVMVACGVNVN